MSTKGILYDYDLIYLGKKKVFSNTFFTGNKSSNEDLAISVFKYAIEYYLRWTPEETAKYLNYEYIRLLKLNSLLSYIDFPEELDKNKDMFYIAHLMYPNRIQYNMKDLVINTYRKILKGEKYKFIKNYMSGTKGYINACICFQFMIEQFLQFSSIEEMYKYFSASDGTKTLRKYRLLAICNEMFHSPLDYLHEALPDNQKNEFLYKYYKFKTSNDKQIKKLIKEKDYII